MNKLLSLVAVGCLTLVFAFPAQAQNFYPTQGRVIYPPNFYPTQNLYTQNFYPTQGVYNYGYNPGYSPIYSPGYAYNSVRINYYPGGIVPHYGHVHYVQPHLGVQYYPMVPTPYGPTVYPNPYYRR